MVLWVWLLSLSIMFSRFIHVVACVSVSFLSWLNNIPLYGYTTFYLSVPSVDGHLGYFHLLVIINNANINNHV